MRSRSSGALALFVLAFLSVSPSVRAEGPPAQPAGLGGCAQESVPERHLICQGRAWLAAGRADLALMKGRLSLQQQPTIAAHLLVGDALRLTGHCKKARPEYVAVLRVVSDDAAAQAGLTACAPATQRVGWTALFEGTAWAEEAPNAGHEKAGLADEPDAPHGADRAPKPGPQPIWPTGRIFLGGVVLALVLTGLVLWISRRDRRAQRAAAQDGQPPQGRPHAALLLLLLLGAGACLSSTAPYTLGSDGPRVLDRHFTPRPGTGGLVFDLDLTVSGLHVPDALELAQADGQQSAERLHCAAYRVELSAPPKEDLSTEWPDDKAKDKAKEAGEPPPEPKQKKTTRILAVFSCPANLLSAPQALGGDTADGGTGGGSVGGAP